MIHTVVNLVEADVQIVGVLYSLGSISINLKIDGNIHSVILEEDLAKNVRDKLVGATMPKGEPATNLEWVLVRVPDGFKLSSKEIRNPKEGEFFLSDNGKVKRAGCLREDLVTAILQPTTINELGLDGETDDNQ